MQNLIFEIVAFLIAVFSFLFGAVKLFKKGKPLYMQILVCAAGCFAIEQISFMVNLWCGVQENVSVNMLGVFGCNLFLLSANYGTLDKIVDDGTCTKKIKILSFIAPAITCALILTAFFAWKNYDLFFAFVSAFVLLPSIPASYFNLKHILLPADSNIFLRTTTPCNVAALIYYFLNASVATLSVLGDLALDGFISALMSVDMLLLVIFSVRGAKKWKI